MTAETEEDDFAWRVTFSKDKPINVEAGDVMAGYPADMQMHLIGEMMIKVGTRLMASTVGDDDEPDDDYDEPVEEDVAAHEERIARQDAKTRQDMLDNLNRRWPL